MLHPAFSSEESAQLHGHQAGSAVTSSEDMSYIRTLRGFRPKIEKLGNVLSVSAMRTMEQAKLDAAAVAASTEDAAAVFSKPERPESDEEPEIPERPKAGAILRRDKPRVSKRARKKEKEDSVFDIKVSGTESSKKEQGEQFYLSTAVDLTDEARERGFDMEQFLGDRSCRDHFAESFGQSFRQSFRQTF